MTKNSARKVSLLALEKMRRNKAFSEDALSSLIKKYKLDSRDTALSVRLCYCVLQNMFLCDFYINSYSSQKTQKLEPRVLDILRISVCQILFFDHIPHRAVVNEAVELCKEFKMDRASGLVNAVLRRISENAGNLPLVPGQGSASYLSVRYSCPLWLCEEYMGYLGYEGACELLEHQNKPIAITAQVNTLKCSRDELLNTLKEAGISAEAHLWLDDCVMIKNAGALSALKSFADGKFYVQDPAACLAVMAAGVLPEIKLLDICAAPGGKSFASAIRMGNAGEILSCDIHEKKLRRIIDGASRLSISIIDVKEMDARKPEQDLKGKFDIVLADVPCSGIGVIRKKPDIRYKDPKDFRELPTVQLEILEGASRCVAENGVLLYSTCTIRDEENFSVIKRFLELHREFTTEALVLPNPIGRVDSGMITLWPHIHETDGFFICKLRRII